MFAFKFLLRSAVFRALRFLDVAMLIFDRLSSQYEIRFLKSYLFRYERLVLSE
jgi:hypothetical protein